MGSFRRFYNTAYDQDFKAFKKDIGIIMNLFRKIKLYIDYNNI
jgi:hypothetical protein